jgi:hypothetical protein
VKTPAHALRAVCAAIVLTLLFQSIGCGKSGSNETKPPPAPKGWTTHKDANFSVNHPDGWQVRADARSGRVEVQDGAGEQVVIWPVFVARPLQASSATAALRRMADRLWPDMHWEQPQPLGDHAVRARGRAGPNVAACAMTWVTTPKGSAAFVYAMAAPEARFRESEDTFAQIFESFHAAGAPAEGQGKGKAGPKIDYAQWQDPKENAFTMEVPRGWNVSGGLFRAGPTDTRAAWQVVSPDGSVRLTGGDAELPYFTLPTQTLAWAGFQEGSWYSPGYGARMLVMRFKPGRQFVKEYVANTVTRGCSQLTFTEERDRPDAVEAINRLNASYGLAMNLNAGEASFTCRCNARLMKGYYFAGTMVTQTPGVQGGIWHVEHLIGFLAAEDKTQLAQDILAHIIQTGRPNPQWVAMQQKVTADTSKIVSRTSDEISKIISDSYWKRSETMDEISRRRSNAILDVEDVVDPQYGEQFKVESGSNYYWIDHRGAIVGTDTYTSPGIDFREMTRLP